MAAALDKNDELTEAPASPIAAKLLPTEGKDKAAVALFPRSSMGSEGGEVASVSDVDVSADIPFATTMVDIVQLEHPANKSEVYSNDLSFSRCSERVRTIVFILSRD